MPGTARRSEGNTVGRGKQINYQAIPEAYRPGEQEGAADDAERSRSTTQEKDGSKRNLIYPEAPEPLPLPVIDNHTHLDFRDGKLNVSVEQAVQAAAQVGVAGLIQVGCDVPSSEFAVRAAQQNPAVLAAVAIHPNDAARLAERGQLDAAIERIDELAGQERVRAVGETGLDYFRTGPEGRPVQEESFRRHIEIARRHGKALQIHDRDAHQDVVRVLRDEQLPPKVVFHCFSGDAQLARICNENGWYMSFAGTVSFKNSTGIQDALALADPRLILVETDAPFLTPHPYRGRPNASYMIPYTLRFMAGHRGADLEQLCSQVMANTLEVYGAF